ncbi:MAG: fdhD [Proteobacteria bacterium]|nr:fdhD [Pseudomonadota bacterium]
MSASRLLPLLSIAIRPLTITVEAVDETGETVRVPIPGEHPLTIYVDKREIVTLMTLGQSPEALVIGYLRNQRLVNSLDEIASVQVDWEVDAAAVWTRSGQLDSAEVEARLQKRTVTTGCGQGTVFGDLMAEIDQVRLPTEARLSEEALFAMLTGVRQYESVYKEAGAVHGCALIENTLPEPKILVYIEDVGRHNAVDAIAGRMWLEEISGDNTMFYTTGRLTSEMVIKAAQMGIPFLVSRSGITQMGWEVARQVGMTVIGRARGRHYQIFSGKERFVR